jgi:hypothetical protein
MFRLVYTQSGVCIVSNVLATLVFNFLKQLFNSIQRKFGTGGSSYDSVRKKLEGLGDLKSKERTLNLAWLKWSMVSLNKGMHTPEHQWFSAHVSANGSLIGNQREHFFVESMHDRE